MSSYEYDFIVLIGRFQPFHAGHLALVEQALKRASRVIILVGSAKEPRTLRNPWTFNERAKMITSSLPQTGISERVHITPMLDYLYEDQTWIKNVQMAVQGIVCQYWVGADGREKKIAVIGYDKDSTSYYLRLFPNWDVIESDGYMDLSATPIRDEYFTLEPGWNNEFAAFLKKHEAALPDGTANFLGRFLDEPEFGAVHEESVYVRRYRQEWSSAPYPPIFVTVDAVVFQAGHVLLVERGMMPGKGLLALPGGFVNPEETLLQSMVRELREETGLRIPVPVLRRAEGPFVFDHPHRSMRGRTITNAFRLHLQESEDGLPEVRGGDDAKKAFWMPLGEIDPTALFDDHSHIIRTVMSGQQKV